MPQNPGYSLDEIHYWLEQIDVALVAVGASNTDAEYVHLYQIGSSWDLLVELSQDGVLSRNGFPTQFENRLKRIEDNFTQKELLFCLSRVKTLLNEWEGEVAPALSENSTLSNSNAEEYGNSAKSESSRDLAIRYSNANWLVLRKSGSVQVLIKHLAAVLEEVAKLAKSTNLPENESALSDIERAQLLAMVETVSAMLKGPMVETNFVTKLKNAAFKGAEKSASKSVEGGLGFALSRLRDLIVSLIEKL